MKNSSNKTKDSHDLSYLLRHDKNYKLENGGWRFLQKFVHEQGFLFDDLCDFVDNNVQGRVEYK